MSRLIEYTATEIVDLLRRREFSCEELINQSFDQIEKLEKIVHAWAYLDRKLAIEQARAVDSGIKAGAETKAFTGVPVGVKDVFNTKDMPTEMGSPIWKDFTPGNDARVVHYLRMAQAVIPGKTVTAEFAVHAPGPTANPHNPEYMPGTSSSGSAAAVASYMVPVALGTQTAGSVIRPSSYCGVFGFKPSFGLIPRTAVLKTTDTLDTIGVFARSVQDLSVLFDTIRVKGRDYPIPEKALNDQERQTKKPGQPWRVAFVKGPKWQHAESYAQSAIQDFARAVGAMDGVEVEELVLPESFNRAHEIHATIYDRTLAYYFREEFKHHTLVSPVMYDIINRGNELTLAQYQVALKEQTALCHELDELLSTRYDVILNLATGGEALKGLESVDRPDNCLIWTLCHVPAINLPVFSGPNKLPFGAQIVARRYNDPMLLSFAELLQRQGLLSGAPYPVPAMAVTGATNPSIHA